MNIVARMPVSRLFFLLPVFGFLINVFVCYPGIPTPDSDDQYASALAGHYKDWHPPIMAWTWARLRLLDDGNGSMFTAHVVLYWLGFGLISDGLMRAGRRTLAFFALGTGVLPQLLSADCVILKDVGMATSLLASVGCVFWFRLQKLKIPVVVWAVALALLAYGALVRANGVFAAAPLAVYYLFPFWTVRPLRFVPATLIVIAILIPASGFFNHHILGAGYSNPKSSLQTFDLVGIAYYSRDVSVLGKDAKPLSTIDYCYHSTFWDNLSGAEIECKGLHEPWDPRRTIDWLNAIEKHPVAYLHHRLAHFNNEMDFLAPWHNSDEQIKQFIVHHKAIEPSHRGTWQILLDYAKNGPTASPLLALTLISGVLLLLFTLTGAHNEVFQAESAALLQSGLIYGLGYFFVGVASDLRYHYWTEISCFLGVVIYLGTKDQMFWKNSKVRLVCGAVVTTFLMIIAARVWIGDALIDPSLVN